MERESKTLATITFQNYFRMYKKLSGMTGTAKTEEEEFQGIYNLDVVQIPTNKPMIRKDLNDMVYKTEARQVQRRRRGDRQAPSDRPAHSGGHRVRWKPAKCSPTCIKLRGVSHEVLNAKYHEKEAEIVAQAGHVGRRDHRHQHGRPRHRHSAGRQPGVFGPPRHAAGGLRGRDHRGGHRPQRKRADEVVLDARKALPRAADEGFKKETDAEHERRDGKLGGLHIIGTERHESPPHRQPAARPRRPPGRPRQHAVLHLPGGRPDAPVRLRAHRRP